MQITAELDSQHLEKLHTLEKTLKKTRLKSSPLLLMKFLQATQQRQKGKTLINLCSNRALLVVWKMTKLFRKIIKTTSIGVIKYDYCRYRLLD